MTKYANKVVDLTGVVKKVAEDTLLLTTSDKSSPVGCPISAEDAKKLMLVGKPVACPDSVVTP
jgi:hypothetical protein